MLKFNGCEFSAAGANKKDQVFGLKLNTSEDVLIEDCLFDGTGYSAILNNTTGAVTIKNCNFECDNFYNPIEGGQSIEQGNLTVENCDFTGIPGNNFINFYNVANETEHSVKNCKFSGRTSNNIIRLSNKNNATATFKFEDIKYKFVSGEVNEYTAFLMLQDYTKRNGNLQDFSKYTVYINNLDRPQEGELYYTYTDGEGINTPDNHPIVYIDGQSIIWGTGQGATGGPLDGPGFGPSLSGPTFGETEGGF